MESPGALIVPPATGLSWHYAALTDVGRMRANNEDALTVDPALGLAILADGMGGYNGGEVASGMAVALLREHVGRWIVHTGPTPPVRAMYRALQAGVDETNAAIYDAGIANPKLQGMGTTLVLGVFGTDRAVIGHIGDSRCYRLRNARLELLTRDHSLLQEQLDAGAITAEAAARSPHRNLVTRALGIEPRVLLEMHAHDAMAGDLYLLCSDGLSELVGDAQLFTLLTQDADLAEKATHLVATANQNGGRDNISVVLAKASGADLPNQAFGIS